MDLYKNKKVLIFGLGLNQGGVGSAKFFAKQGAKVRVTDLKSKTILKPSLNELKDFPKIEYTLGKHKNEDIDWADLIIKNPAVKRDSQYLNYARQKKKSIETDLGIFFKLVNKSQMIGVTGTKGKSTTASLIYEGLKGGGKKVILAGNIGRSVLDALPFIKDDTLIVLEISSFQLEGLIPYRISPKYAVITNIYPDHLNHYPGMYEYIETKRLIAQFQTEYDFLFLNKDDLTLNNSKFLKPLSTNIIFYSTNDLSMNFKPTLAGKHNLANYAASLAVSRQFLIPEDQALKTMKKFKGAQFRLQTIKNWKGVRILNDTTSTSPSAGIQALQTFPNSIVIAGGMNKNMPYVDYVKTLEANAKEIFFLAGDSTDLIISLLKKSSSKVKFHGPYHNLKKLLKDVKRIVAKGDIILFSPAATSYNLFQNEFDRGRQFNMVVEKIFK